MSARTVAVPSTEPDTVGARIAGVEIRRYAVTLDPPFRAAWDPTPRETVGATLVIVRSQDGVAGYASGGDVPDAALLERLLIGIDPMRTEAVREIFETVDFHGGRPWTVEVAIWDLVGRLVGQPLWRLPRGGAGGGPPPAPPPRGGGAPGGARRAPAPPRPPAGAPP